MGDGQYELATEPRWEFAYQLSKALPDCEYTEINYIPDGQIPDLPVSQYGYDVLSVNGGLQAYRRFSNM